MPIKWQWKYPKKKVKLLRDKDLEVKHPAKQKVGRITSRI
jgi:hypothetical protein